MRLARARDRHRRLTISALVALAGALVTWVIGLDLGARAVTTVAAAVAAWLVPLRGSDTWALHWIGRSTGLAYQTALETVPEPAAETTTGTTTETTATSDIDLDRYGMRGALLERAKESVGHVEEPRHSPWWLPILALAAGVLLLPALPNVTIGGPNFGGSQPTNGSPPGAPPGDEEAAEQQPEPELPDQERSRVDPGPTEAGAGAGADDGEMGEGGAAGERDALERFLRNVRERPRTAAEERQESGGAAGDAQEGARRESTREPGEGEEPRAGEEQRQRADEGGEDGQDGAEDGEQGTGDDPGNPFAEAGAEEQAEAEDESGESSDQGAGDADQTQGAEEPGEPGAGRGDEGAGDEPGLGEGAGGQPSPDQATEPGEQREGETLFLEGDLRSGPITPGGTVQLPGSDDAELPAGSSPESYRREVERAVTEGRVPLEYQEIIRNYFR